MKFFEFGNLLVLNCGTTFRLVSCSLRIYNLSSEKCVFYFIQDTTSLDDTRCDVNMTWDFIHLYLLRSRHKHTDDDLRNIRCIELTKLNSFPSVFEDLIKV